MDPCRISLSSFPGNMQGDMRHGCLTVDVSRSPLRLRLLVVLLALVAALAATVPAAAGASDGEYQASSTTAEDGPDPGAEPEPEEPEPIPDFWSEELPAEGGGSPTSSNQASTSPGGTGPASGTLGTGPGAPASTPTSPGAGAAAACDPRITLREALRSLRAAIGRRNLLSRDAKPVSVGLAPCLAGTLELAVVVEGRDTVVWRARRVLSSSRPVALRLTMTAAGRRFIARASRGRSRTVRLRLRAQRAS